MLLFFSFLVERRFGKGRGTWQEGEQRWLEQESYWLETCSGRCRWFQKVLVPQGVPPLASAAFPDSSYCSEARCKGFCSRILPPSPSQVRKKPWVRGTKGLQAGEGLPLCQARCRITVFIFFFEVKTTHEAPPSLPRAPPLSLGHLVVVAMETTSKMACKSTQQEQQEKMGPGSEGSWKCFHPQHPWNKRLWIPRGLRRSPICNVARDRG